MLNSIELASRDGYRCPWNSGRNGWVFDGLIGLRIGASFQKLRVSSI